MSSWLEKKAAEAAAKTNPDHRYDERGHNEVVADAIVEVAREHLARFLRESLIPEYDVDTGKHTVHACITYGDDISFCAGSVGVFETIEHATEARDEVIQGASAAAEKE